MADHDATTTPTAAVTPDKAADGPAFTQADIDRIVKERLMREREKLTERYADYDALKAAKARLDEIEQARLSDDEKLKARLKELEDRAQAAQQERDSALSRANERLLRAAIIAEASQQGFLNADDAYALVDKTKLSVGDDGEAVGAATAVRELADKRPYLLRKQQAPNLNGGAGGGTGSDLPKLTPEQEAIARNMGVTLEVYAKRLAEVQAAKQLRR